MGCACGWVRENLKWHSLGATHLLIWQSVSGLELTKLEQALGLREHPQHPLSLHRFGNWTQALVLARWALCQMINLSSPLSSNPWEYEVHYLLFNKLVSKNSRTSSAADMNHVLSTTVSTGVHLTSPFLVFLNMGCFILSFIQYLDLWHCLSTIWSQTIWKWISWIYSKYRTCVSVDKKKK